MNENVLNNIISNKKVLILGFGKEGRSTYQFLRKYFPDQLFYIADQDKNLSEKYHFQSIDKIALVLGNAYMDKLTEYDLIIKTPGISLKNMETAQLKSLSITSQTDLFLHVFSKFFTFSEFFISFFSFFKFFLRNSQALEFFRQP